jgi:hypothetical protein
MKRENASKKCRRLRQMSNRVSKRSTIHLRSSALHSVVILDNMFDPMCRKGRKRLTNVEISTPVEVRALSCSTVHFAQSSAHVAQPSFPQVFDGDARTNASLACQMPVLNAKAIRVSLDHRGWNRRHTFKNGGFRFCDELRLCLQVLSRY